jgi:dTDP-glucose 4,6-dehydratase
LKTILITGGCGFIGSNFVRYLSNLSQEIQIINLDKLTYAGNSENLLDLENSKNYKFVHGDIGDKRLLDNLFKNDEIDFVVNFAAESHVDRSIDSPEPFFETNVIGTLRLLNSAREYWQYLSGNKKEGFRFLHVSTDEVFGSLNSSDPAFTEETPYQPNSPYSASKASSDHIVRAGFHTYGMPVITTNCSNNYGPYQFPEKLIPLMVLNALEGKSLPIYGDGMNVRDWLYVEDHCDAIWSVLKGGNLGETYNIGGCNEMPNLEIIDSICSLLDEKKPRKDQTSYQDLKIFVKDRPGHDYRYAIDCSKINRELGWKPKETFNTGINKTIDWYLENTNWCDHIFNKSYQRQRLGTQA